MHCITLGPTLSTDSNISLFPHAPLTGMHKHWFWPLQQVILFDFSLVALSQLMLDMPLLLCSCVNGCDNTDSQNLLLDVDSEGYYQPVKCKI